MSDKENLMVSINPDMNKKLYLCAEAIENFCTEYGDVISDGYHAQLESLIYHGENSGNQPVRLDFNMAALGNEEVDFSSIESVLAAADTMEIIDYEYDLEDLDTFRDVELKNILFRGSDARKGMEAIKISDSPNGAWSKYAVVGIDEPVNMSVSQGEKTGQTYIQFGTMQRPSVHGVLVFDYEVNLSYCPDTNIWSGDYIDSDGRYDLGLAEASDKASKLGLNSAVSAFCADHNMSQPDFDRKPNYMVVQSKNGFVPTNKADHPYWQVEGTGHFVEINGNTYELMQGADEYSKGWIDDFVEEKAGEWFDTAKHTVSAPAEKTDKIMDKPMSFRDPVFAQGADALNEQRSGASEPIKEENLHE